MFRGRQFSSAFCFLLAGMAGWLLIASIAHAQQSALEDFPKPFVQKRPLTRQEVSERDSLKQYALGLLCEREDRLLEALKAFQEAVRLDPEAVAALKAQIPIFLALDRVQEAATAVEKTLNLDPADHETWFVGARVYKSLGKYKDAGNALRRGLDAPGIKERPEVAQQMYLDLAGLHEAADELPQAVVALTKAAELLDHPDVLVDLGVASREAIVGRAAQTYERIGHHLAKLKKYDEALKAFQQAQERRPESAGRLSYNLAQLCKEQGKFEEALTHVDIYLRFQPIGVEAYEMKIGLLEKLKRTAQIAPWLETASKNDPHNTGLKVLLAKEYVRGKQTAKAEQLYKSLAGDSPNADIYRGLFRLYKSDPQWGTVQTLGLVNKTLDQASKAEGPPGPAVQQAKAMIAALRDDGELAKDLVAAGLKQADVDENLRFETLHLLAILADKHRKTEEAEKFYRKALAEASPASEALVYSGLFRTLWKAHKYSDVLLLARDGLKRSRATNRLLFFNEQAKALARLQRFDEALRAAGEGAELAGDNDKLAFRHLRVRILVQAEKHEEAEADCQTLLRESNSPGEAIEVRYLLSNVYSAQRKMAQAEEQLEIILKADPNNATVNNDLGYIWADQSKHLERSEEMIRKAIDLDRYNRKLRGVSGTEVDLDNAAYVDSLGWVLFRRGKIDEARIELEKAVALPDGDEPVLWDHLGDVYYRLRQFDRARSAWQRSIHLYEQEKRRKMDERYHEVQRKLKLVNSQ